MRFKPPPPNSNIGWRVEFRSMEIQITDFENTAFAILIVLLTRAILSFGLNFYIPISKVDENMKKAHRRGAVLNEKFYFRKNVFTKQRKSQSHHKQVLVRDCSLNAIPVYRAIIKTAVTQLFNNYSNTQGEWKWSKRQCRSGRSPRKRKRRRVGCL
jgi:hypothetical protein